MASFKLKDGPPRHTYFPPTLHLHVHTGRQHNDRVYTELGAVFLLGFFAANTRSVTFQCPSLSQQLCKQLMFRCTLGGLWTGAAAANMSTVCYLKNEPSQQQGWVQSAPGPPFALIWRHHIDTQIAKSCQSMMSHTSVWGSK